MRHWSSGRIKPSQGFDPGSIPGWRISELNEEKFSATDGTKNSFKYKKFFQPDGALCDRGKFRGRLSERNLRCLHEPSVHS